MIPNTVTNKVIRSTSLFLLLLLLSSCIATSPMAALDMQAIIDKYPLPDLSETKSWRSKLVEIDGLMHATKYASPYTGRYVSYLSGLVDEANGENRIFITGSYTDGLKSGAWVTYDKHGKIYSIKHYQGGKRHGKHYQWWLMDGYGGPQHTEWWSIDDLDDTLEIFSNYINGVKDGVETLWHMNGEVDTVREYANGV